jgi:ParB family chromosome partitioning protein
VRDVDDASSLAQAVVENIHRRDLHPLEEAAAYRQLLEDFDLTHEQLAQRVGRSRSSITNTLRLLQLPAKVQRLVADGALSGGHARTLLGCPDRAYQEQLAARAATEGWSVRALEDAVRERTEREAVRPPARRNSSHRPAAFLELEHLLAEYLSTGVSVRLSSNKGRIVIDFATLDDLERIYRLITPTGSERRQTLST